MDLAYEHLWAAGYNLPLSTPPDTGAAPANPPKRRGKKAARAKRQKAQK